MPFNGISFSSASLQALTFKVCQFLVQSLMVSLTWILLFYLNALIFQTLSINHLVSWIFLPACIRLLSVLIFEWAGVFGLFLGALVTSVGPDIYHINPWILALISALGPYFSATICRYILKLPNTLAGLNTKQLLFFAVMNGLVNASLNHLYFQFTDVPASFRVSFLPIIVGDMIGTIILLYIFAFIIKLIHALFDANHF